MQIALADSADTPTKARDDQESPNDLGITVETLTPDIARRLGLSDEQGVLVTGVEPGSLAERAGIRPRDAIVAVGNSPMRGAQEFQEAIKKQDLSHGIRMQVDSEAGRHYVFMKSIRPPA